MIYQYAIKDPKTGFEVRYFVYIYKRGDKQRTKLTYNVFLSTILNGLDLKKTTPNILTQSPEDIKKDFNADWGVNAVFQPSGAFGNGFQLCSAQAIQKKNLGEIYIFWMFTDVEKQENLINKSFISLKFK